VPPTRTVAVTTLGCARNEVDSEELAGRLANDGWLLVEDAETADVVLVNTCGFVEAAKRDSINTLLEAADLKKSEKAPAVVAVGCLAERYGQDLAAALPEADAVLGFDDYADISARLRSVLAGEKPGPPAPRDRRHLLPMTPTQRPGTPIVVPGHGGVGSSHGPLHLQRVLRRRLAGGPAAPLKIASGCDRRCSFCAIPSFRGAFVSRRPAELIGEARWLAERGVRELVLVSENSTSYGKDLADVRLLETVLPQLAALDGIERVRVSYLQPAEIRPSLLDVMTSTAGVVPYFDLSFQHASPSVLRRMRRFGDGERFLELLAAIRQRCPPAGIRSNFIVGFPGETEADLAELERFLADARLDAVGVFGYSDEDGTEAAGMDGKLPAAEIHERVAWFAALADLLAADRAAERIGEAVDVLVESSAADVDAGQGPAPTAEGRAAHQAPEVDGTTTLTGPAGLLIGQLVPARVVDAVGADLHAVMIGAPR
jgi:ribosomal protein S12 methylthiotransferase RimO